MAKLNENQIAEVVSALSNIKEMRDNMITKEDLQKMVATAMSTAIGPISDRLHKSEKAIEELRITLEKLQQSKSGRHHDGCER